LANHVKKIVDTGTYEIGSGGNTTLEAYLGTCVGVTIFDWKMDIGGMIHLLLSEPQGLDGAFRPEPYASTGLPIFIKALWDAGGRKENFKACVAGGALVGDPSSLDLRLDIGGRTAEMVEKILKEEHIPIISSETGGYFSCKMSLDMSTWKTGVEPVGVAPSLPVSRPILLAKEQIRQLVGRIHPIPQVSLKILRMVKDGNYNFEDVAQVVRQDQTISAKVIRLCNSPMLRREQPVESIDRALALLGEKKMLLLVVSASMEDSFPSGTRGYSLCKGGLFQHAMGTAVVAERLADLTGLVHPDLAYTAGLLHDVGKIALDQFIARDFPLFYRRTQFEGLTLLDTEQERFGVDHTSLGNLLAEVWELPGSLRCAITHHHFPEVATEHRDLVHVIYFADLIMSRFMVGLEMEHMNTARMNERLARIGFKPDQFGLLVDTLLRDENELG
jgi:putative nucleotidyltransferase with HDIG domain